MTMAMNRKQWVDQDGDVLHVSRWPALKGGVVFEARERDERHGTLVELRRDQVKQLIEFLQANG